MSKNETSGKVIASNFLWNLMERWGAQGVTFIVSVILARLLDPSAYGIVAMASVFTAILGVFIDSGLGSALVQKKDNDEKDFSKVFFFNVFMCTVLYIIMFFAAPLIADFYGMSDLTAVVRVASLTLIISGFKNILISRIQRKLHYKKFFFATLGGTIGAAFIGVFMAFKGFGVWALVTQSLFNGTVDTIILWITEKWKPELYFSWKRLKVLFSFGIKMLGSSLVDTIYSKLRNLIIGKKYSAEDLAYYDKSSGWPNLVFVNIGGAVDSVMFPVMSRAQDDKSQVKSLMSKTIRVNTFVVFPLLAGLAVCAEPAIVLILTSKWLPLLWYMRIFCVTSGCDAIHNTQMNMIRSIGRSDLFLLMNFIKKAIGIAALLITMWISVLAMAVSLIAVKLIELTINFFIVRKLLDYPILEQIKDFAINILLCIIMIVPIIFISFINMPNLVKLLIEITVGAGVFFFAAKIIKLDSFEYVKKIASSLFRRKKL